MLLTFMYHRVTNSNFPNAEHNFRKHLCYLANHYPIVTPDEPLKKGQLSVCLTFDDAYFDFYHTVYPLLKELNIKAQLSVPTKFILNSTDLDAQLRLNVSYDQVMEGEVYKDKVPFCTWLELKEMVASGHVNVASHSHNHVDLTQNAHSLDEELIRSKRILETKLGTKVQTFVYPFGNLNREIHRKVLKHYTIVMRIGSALNFNWHNAQNITYRIDAEQFWPNHTLWNNKHYGKYILKLMSNIVRRK